MFNATEILIDAFTRRQRRAYRRMYGSQKHEYEEVLCWVSVMALECIANSDALYHNLEHTILVTLVGQEVLRGKHMREGGISPDNWLHFLISLVCHDIGYVRGVCRADRREANRFATGRGDEMIELPAGCSDASLTPFHVDRGKLFIRERFGGHPFIDAETICRNIELTRFPVPEADDHQDTVNCPGLLRAADLIGQMSDPRYLRKGVALFYEFEEIGMNRVLGYKNPGDLRKNYPSFYWQRVHHYIKDGLRYLSQTQLGKQMIANLYAHVFMVEHEMIDDGHFRQGAIDRPD